MSNPYTAGTDSTDIPKAEYTEEELEEIKQKNLKIAAELKAMKKAQNKKLGKPEDYKGPVKANFSMLAKLLNNKTIISKQD